MATAINFSQTNKLTQLEEKQIKTSNNDIPRNSQSERHIHFKCLGGIPVQLSIVVWWTQQLQTKTTQNDRKMEHLKARDFV